MIPKDFITEWRAEAPWVSDAQVEQDLVISRAVVELFRVDELAKQLAFRGGAALSRVHMRPSVRYSEDIDLVQILPEPIGDTFDAVRDVLDPWLGTPRRDVKEAGVTLVYRFSSEDQPARPMRLKVEINSREHFTELGYMLTARSASAERIIACFERYMHEGGHRVSRALFEENLANKLLDPTFRSDMIPLLRPDVSWDIEHAAAVVLRELVARLR